MHIVLKVKKSMPLIFFTQKPVRHCIRDQQIAGATPDSCRLSVCSRRGGAQQGDHAYSVLLGHGTTPISVRSR